MERVNIFLQKGRCVVKYICILILSLYLGPHNFTEPCGKSTSIPEYRLVDMFTSGMHPKVKGKII